MTTRQRTDFSESFWHPDLLRHQVTRRANEAADLAAHDNPSPAMITVKTANPSDSK